MEYPGSSWATSSGTAPQKSAGYQREVKSHMNDYGSRPRLHYVSCRYFGTCQTPTPIKPERTRFLLMEVMPRPGPLRQHPPHGMPPTPLPSHSGSNMPAKVEANVPPSTVNFPLAKSSFTSGNALDKRRALICLPHHPAS